MLGLVLSGGAAWGMAHIGVLEVLHEEDVPIDLVVGTSAGAIMGALFASGVRPEQMRSLACELGWSDLGRLTVPGMGFADSSAIEQVIEEVIGEGRTFDALPIPLKIIATDINRGEQVVIDSGNVARAARASASIPVIFTPVEYPDVTLVDGGVVNNLPVDVARTAGADKVVAVQLVHAFPQQNPDNLAELGFLAFSIMQKYSMKPNAEMADVLMVPDLSGINSMDLSAHETLIARGRAAAERRLDALRSLLHR